MTTSKKINFDYVTTPKKTQLMGIVNCTPDSFYDGGCYSTHEQAIVHSQKLIDEGADMLDIGGESTRPKSTAVSAKEELHRVFAVVKKFARNIKISIDTSKPEVAKPLLDEGVQFLNDISGLQNPKMVQLALEYDCDLGLMHMQGTPQTMQQNPTYPQGVVEEIVAWFKKRIEELTSAGIKKERIYLDPGIGFGKTVEHNLTILRNLPTFQSLGFPLLIGLSRKSFMSKILGVSPCKLLSTTLAMNTICISEGVSIIRVHDVKEHRDIIDLMHTFLHDHALDSPTPRNCCPHGDPQLSP